MYKLAIVMVLLVSGCASNTSFPNVSYGRDIEKKYPPVSVVLNDGYVASSSLCTQYGCETFIDQSGRILLTALRDTAIFERVDMNNAYSEYRLAIEFKENLQGSEAAEFSKLMLGAATLFLVPTASDMEASFAVSIFYKNEVVKEYAYKTQYSRTASLFLDAQDARKKSIKYLVDLLMKDVQQDAIFVGPKEAVTTGKVGMVVPRPGKILGLVTR